MATTNAGSVLKWVTTVFDKDKEKANFADNGDVKAQTNGTSGNKRLSVERIYQKKSQLEHILLRPDTYIGSVEKVTQLMWVYDEESSSMIQRELTYVPGLYKIFDEILVNASDNKQRDPNMTTMKIDIDPENNKIKIWNNGKGIPVVEHKTEKMYVPSMIFGHLLTSSNFDDTERKVTGGRNGYGAKLCNVFSTKFVVETQSNEYKKAFKQVWSDNMTKAGEPKIVSAKGEDYTCVTFSPDLYKFKMEKLDKDIVDLFVRRAYDIAASTKGIKVFLNGKKLPIKNFKEYVELYTKGKADDDGNPLKIVYEAVNPRWEIALALSEKGFQNVSFVNSIATTKGGRHVDYIADQLVSKLIEVLKKKEKKGGIQIKPFQVKNHLWVFVNCLIENPTFDSQTKENMTLQAKSFGSKCLISDKFINQAAKCGVVEAVMSWMKYKQQSQLNKKMSAAKHSKLKGIPKLDDANDAGTRNSINCTLILTEGDSAKTLAVAGLSVVGRDKFGVFPLRGKVLNVREATHKQIMENAEVNNIIKILGLRYKEKYDSEESLKTLRYGKMMIMTDQDQDGSHIKGLLINFIHHNWPHLLKQNFLEEFITPIVKVTKNKQELSFYSLPEFEEWKSQTNNWHTWRVKYYKGLGTSTAKEAKEYFAAMDRHKIPFKYSGPEDDSAIVLAFSKKKIEERKEWLTNWMEERKRRALLGLPDIYLYGKDTRFVTYNEFVNRELILFSNMDNERSIPNLVDGFKPGQRKVLFACLKRNLVKEMKVAQLAGSVAELSAYHHGEVSLMSTIINLAQNFVGSNNINLLMPLGQFGTRLHGGKDAASPRYIFTMLSSVTKMIFNPNDEALLKSLYDDNNRIEPEWYVPIIPMVLVNGAEGIGTGWSTKIPNYDPREIISNLKRLMAGEQPQKMLPWYKGFKGTIEEIDEFKYVTSGEVSIIDDQTIEITELPIKTWTQTYKENVLEPMLTGTDKVQPLIIDFKEYHTDTTVKFIIKMAPEKLAQAEEQGLHKVFKLQTTMSTNSMVLFDSKGCIKRYSNIDEILKEFYEVRLDFYHRRKDYMEGMLAAESLKLDNIARFICEKIDGIIVIENKPKKEIIQTLVRRGYDPDPVKAWKESQNKLQALEDMSDNNEEEESGSGGPSSTDFNYLLSMQLWCLTKEKKDELLKQRDDKSEELYQLRKKSPKDLWMDDLEIFLKELDVVEQKQEDDDSPGSTIVAKTAKSKGKCRQRMLVSETKPSPMGRRVIPRIDPAIIARAGHEANAKRKKAMKKENNSILDEDISVADDDELKPLSSRIKKGLGVKKASPTKKDQLSPKKPKQTKAGKKRSAFDGSDSDLSEGEFVKKAKKPFHSDSEDDMPKKKKRRSGSDSDEFELNEDIELEVQPRERPARERKQVKYNVDEMLQIGVSDEEDADEYCAPQTLDQDGISEDSDHEVKSYTASLPTKATKKTMPAIAASISDSESDKDSDFFSTKSKKSTMESSDEEFMPYSPKHKQNTKKAAPKKPASKSKPANYGIFDEKPKKAAPKKRAPKKALADGGDEDDDDIGKKTKKTTKRKPAKKAAQKFSYSDSDDEFVMGSEVNKDDSFDMDVGDALPPRRQVQQRKKISYNIDDDTSDSDL